jgi:hypothetical protein
VVPCKYGLREHITLLLTSVFLGARVLGGRTFEQLEAEYGAISKTQKGEYLHCIFKIKI